MVTILQILLFQLTCFAPVQTKTIYCTYSYEYISPNIDCYISFYDTGDYELDIYSWEGDDNCIIDNFSFGKYKIEGDNILMTDFLNDSRLHFKYYNDSIVGGIGVYSFLSGKVLKKIIGENYGDNRCRNYKLIPVNELRKQLSLYSGTPRLIENGIFSNNIGYKLVLNENRRYVYKLKELILSEGVWQQEKNELIMFDEYVLNKFYFNIDSNVVTEISFSGREHSQLSEEK
jgi:hypothetical protein